MPRIEYQSIDDYIGGLDEEAAAALHSKATLRFPLDERVPTRLITRVAKLRAAEVEELMLAKAAKKKAAKTTKPTPQRKPAKRQAKQRARLRSGT